MQTIFFSIMKNFMKRSKVTYGFCNLYSASWNYDTKSWKYILAITPYHDLSWKIYVNGCFSIVIYYKINDLTYIKRMKRDHTVQNWKWLPFIDTTIIRDDNGSLNLRVYRKPTPNGGYLEYNSSSPSSHKQDIAVALQKRAFTICEGQAEKFQEQLTIRKDLRKNGLPEELIQMWILYP